MTSKPKEFLLTRRYSTVHLRELTLGAKKTQNILQIEPRLTANGVPVKFLLFNLTALW